MKRNFWMLTLSIFVLSIMTGCQNDLPKPESKSKIIPFVQASTYKFDSNSELNQNSEEKPSLFVQYKTRGTNVMVECILSGISFRESDSSKEKLGKMVVWVDDRKFQEVSTAAFIVKGLTPGNHKVRLEVIDLNNRPYGLTKEFMVNIPK
ncbi:hypothetical protein E2K98_01495 [Bacillus salipaludis]|uniref:Uncharacterized protein n=1 Tax=Bacillus salipaludis TaxID=2547811 RepID=A0A4R5VZD9_9BACI|nr:DUF6130 family protein [Bacillus salipaludis]TDK64948.1 hypothetical protein E2K98_01495 [Bacillus salipaludis]